MSESRNRSNRGRGRGASRFNWNKTSTTKREEPKSEFSNTEYTRISSGDSDIKNEAKSIVKSNSNKPPVTLKKFLSGWNQTKRRNIEIELNPEFARNITSDWITLSASFFKNYYNHDDFNSICHFFESMLYCGLAQKLIVCNPRSEFPKLGIFSNIANIEFYLPPKFITVIESIGKSEEAHLRTKIMYNSTWLKRMIYNAVRHGIAADKNNRIGWIKEDTYDATVKYYNVVFPDEDSLKYIKDSASKWLSKVTEYKFKAKVGENELEVRVPDFPKDKDKATVIAWYNNIMKGKLFDSHTDLQNALTFTVVTYIMDIRYLLRPEKTLDTFDKVFEGTGMAKKSVLTVLADCQWYHIHKMCTEDNLYRNFGLLTEELNESWTPLIKKVVKLEKFNPNKYGTMGLILKPESSWFKKKTTIIGKEVNLPSSNVEGSSIYQTEHYDGIAINMMYGITSNTYYKDNYTIKVNQPIDSVRSNFIGTDFVDFSM